MSNASKFKVDDRVIVCIPPDNQSALNGETGTIVEIGSAGWCRVKMDDPSLTRNRFGTLSFGLDELKLIEQNT